MRQRYDTWTVKGMRLEAGAIRDQAQRMMDTARELDREADQREYEALMATLDDNYEPMDEYPPGFDEQYDIDEEA
jgi:hypothetical protein